MVLCVLVLLAGPLYGAECLDLVCEARLHWVLDHPPHAAISLRHVRWLCLVLFLGDYKIALWFFRVVFNDGAFLALEKFRHGFLL
jgi:hypothetical protein